MKQQQLQKVFEFIATMLDESNQKETVQEEKETTRSKYEMDSPSLMTEKLFSPDNIKNSITLMDKLDEKDKVKSEDLSYKRHIKMSKDAIERAIQEIKEDIEFNQQQALLDELRDDGTLPSEEVIKNADLPKAVESALLLHPIKITEESIDKLVEEIQENKIQDALTDKGQSSNDEMISRVKKITNNLPNMVSKVKGLINNKNQSEE